jgi:hypothetical protein
MMLMRPRTQLQQKQKKHEQAVQPRFWRVTAARHGANRPSMLLNIIRVAGCPHACTVC